jgi:hypothetical protein
LAAGTAGVTGRKQVLQAAEALGMTGTCNHEKQKMLDNDEQIQD